MKIMQLALILFHKAMMQDDHNQFIAAMCFMVVFTDFSFKLLQETRHGITCPPH